MKLVYIILILSLALTGCKENNQNNFGKVVNNDNQTIDVEDALKKIGEIETISFPYTDSTSFDNFKKLDKMTDLEVKKLKLKTINDGASDFFLRYKIPFTDNFESVAVTYQVGEHELVTTLINYDSNYNILDKLDIAYDEIAESAFKKIGILEKYSLKIDEINLMEDSSVHKVTEYTILNNGKFKTKN